VTINNISVLNIIDINKLTFCEYHFTTLAMLCSSTINYEVLTLFSNLFMSALCWLSNSSAVILMMMWMIKVVVSMG